jgi:hypothetical protein
MTELGPIIFSALIILAISVAAIYRPSGGRLLFGIGFLIAAVVNTIIAVYDPQGYVVFADQALFRSYTDIWYTAVVANLPTMLSLLIFFQILVAALISSRGIAANVGFFLGAIFLLVLVPANPWSVPNLFLAIAMIYLGARRWDGNIIEEMEKPGEKGSAPSTFRHRTRRTTFN